MRGKGIEEKYKNTKKVSRSESANLYINECE
jgi:hypothetical protein